MKKKIAFYVILCLVLFILTGCGLANSYFLTYNFEKNMVMVANVGAEMLNWTEIYKNDVYGNVKGKFEQTLTYSGKQLTCPQNSDPFVS